MSDNNQRKTIDCHPYLAAEILAILNDTSSLADSINHILAAIKRGTGFDAVGIRLRKGDDYPYFVQDGFSHDFLLTENTLIARDEMGGPCLDENGNISLECACGLVLSGYADSTNPLFTKGGSFWTNNILPLLDMPAEQEIRLNPRNSCIRQGYLSMAIIPIRSEGTIIGLLQLNDREKDRLTLDMILFLEKIAASIGIAVMRKHTEESLRISQESLSLVLEGSQLGIWDWNLETGEVKRNARWAEMLGYKLPEIEFTVPQWTDFLHPDDREAAEKSITDHLEGRTPSHIMEYRMRTKDGQYRWILDQARIMKRDPNGKPIRMGGTHTDITNRKRIEIELAEARKHLERKVQERTQELAEVNKQLAAEINERKVSEQRYRIVADNTYDWELWISPEQDIIYISPSCERITGYLPHEFQQNKKLLLEIVHPGDLQRFKEHFFADLKRNSSEIKELEFRIIHKNGDLRWIGHLCRPVFADDGVYIGIRVSNRDITEHKLAELALLESEEKYRNIFNNAIEGIFQTTPEGRFLSINPAFARMFGYRAPEEMIASINDIGQQLYVNPQDREGWKELTVSQSVVENIKAELYRKDGSKIWISFSAQAVKDREGNILHYGGMVDDISEKIKAEEEKLYLEKQLRQAQKIEAIGTLAGGIAHDFNNILGAISGFTELSMEHVPETSKAQEYLKRIYVATRRAVDLVSQILTFSRQTERELKTLRMNPMIKEVLKLVRATTPATIDIRHNISANPDLVMADVTCIHQVVLNLCMNATQEMQKKGGILSVGLINEHILIDDHAHPDINPGKYLKLTVSDTGEGIEPRIMDKIFDPFFTTKNPGEGTGLGLAVVYGIVKSLGGKIKVDSRLGHGTTFEVWLPQSADTPFEGASEEGSSVSVKGNGRILFVDDEEELVEMASDMLEGLGYEVTATQSSIDALERFHANPEGFDLVITDQTMPVMTGISLAHEIMRIRPDTPVILCTGYSSIMDKEEINNVGIREIVIKPVTRRKLAATIHQILKKNDLP